MFLLYQLSTSEISLSVASRCTWLRCRLSRQPHVSASILQAHLYDPPILTSNTNRTHPNSHHHQPHRTCHKSQCLSSPLSSPPHHPQPSHPHPSSISHPKSTSSSPSHQPPSSSPKLSTTYTQQSTSAAPLPQLFRDSLTPAQGLPEFQRRAQTLLLRPQRSLHYQRRRRRFLERRVATRCSIPLFRPGPLSASRE